MMAVNLKSLSQKRTYFIMGAVWILVWIIPWGNLPSIQEGNVLALLTDMIRLGVALIIQIVPGVLLYLLIIPKVEPESNPLGIFPIGFTFSITIISVIGLLGRLMGLSFSTVKTVFVLVGLIEIILLSTKSSKLALDKKTLFASLRNELKNPPLILALVLATIMTFHAYHFIIDDASYLAYLTNWQHASNLGFNNLVHEVDIIEHSRFWLAMYPMSQAVLADLSGLPGLLLLGSYLELFLVPLAVLTTYWLARKLGISPTASGFATLFQVTILAWMVGDDWPVGMWFYQCMAEDKVTAVFIFSPLFFIFGLDAIQNPDKEKWGMFVLAGLAISLSHPVILFFSSCILLGMTTIALVLKKISLQQIIQVGIIIATFMLPYLFLRGLELPSQAQISFDAASVKESYQIDKIIQPIGGPYYGLNPEMLKFIDIKISRNYLNIPYQAIRFVPVVIILVSAIIAFVRIHDGTIYWYIFSSGLLITFATLPYTGWLIGYFVSPRMVYRSSWFFSFGIAGVLILMSAKKWLGSHLHNFRSHRRRFFSHFSDTFVGVLVCFILISPILLNSVTVRIPAYFTTLDYYKQLAQVGKYIDQDTTQPVIAFGLTYIDSVYLPGISANVRLISFREQNVNPHSHFMSLTEKEERLEATNTLRTLDHSIPDEERCGLMEKYTIRFVLARSDQSNQFMNLIEPCESQAMTVFSTEELQLLEITGY